MQNTLANDKAVLAKLLAAENITVQHLNVKTASFDPTTRILTCPVWQDMDGNMYDLLMGHEVGHALFTPAEGWHDALLSSVNAKSLKDIKGLKGLKDLNTFKKFKGFLNVVEDARIEKKIRNRFPGLRKPFLEAYKGLLNSDFFGINQLNGDFSCLNLIDRLNLHFKIGSQLVIRFTDEEREFVKAVAACETWAEVVAVTNKIWQYVKDNEQQKANNDKQLQEAMKDILRQMKGKPQEIGNSEDDGDDFETLEIQDENSEGDADDSRTDENGSTPEETEESEESSKSGNTDSDDDSDDGESDGDTDSDNGEGDSTDEMDDDAEGEDATTKGTDAGSGGENLTDKDPESVTDNAFRRKEDELIDSKAKPYIFLDLPECNLNDTIIPNKLIVETFERETTYGMTSFNKDLSYKVVSQKLIADFNRNNANYINLLVKEFEMRKNATQYARQLQSKTGEIDTRRLDRYRFSNDIFRKVTDTPKGKSHGMILFVDMSGSMNEIIRNTIEQTLVLVTFCKKVGIPFEVYGFNDAATEYGAYKSFVSSKFRAKTHTAFNMNTPCFNLKTLITSDLSSREFTSAMAMMLIFGNFTFSYEAQSLHNHVAPNAAGFVLNPNATRMFMNGTPLIETLIASRQIIERFKTKTHVDIVNSIYLTDGDGGSFPVFPQYYHDAHRQSAGGVNVGFVDPVTKKRVMAMDGNYQAAITTLVRAATGCRHIGYYIGNEHTIAMKLSTVMENIDAKTENKMVVGDLRKAYNASLRNDGFFSAPTLGYDEYFFVPIKEKSIVDAEVVVEKGSSTTEIADAFLKNQQKKRVDRVIAGKFAGLIAA